jgi:hypothetical protein
MRAITWEPPEDVELQFWSHPDSATAGAFTVKASARHALFFV